MTFKNFLPIARNRPILCITNQYLLNIILGIKSTSLPGAVALRRDCRKYIGFQSLRLGWQSDKTQHRECFPYNCTVTDNIFTKGHLQLALKTVKIRVSCIRRGQLGEHYRFPISCMWRIRNGEIIAYEK